MIDVATSSFHPYSDVLPLLDRVLEKFEINKLSHEEQTLFYLEFSRVARLRFDERLKKSGKEASVDTSSIFLEELMNLAQALLGKSI